MSRVAKRGVIEVPHRGKESLKNNYEENIWCFGTEHHKWLIEIIDKYICFTIKNSIYLMYHPIPRWNGPDNIKYLWNDKIDYLLMYDICPKNMHDNYTDFRERNKEYWL